MSSEYREIRTKLLSKLRRQNIVFYTKLGGTYSYDCASLYHFLAECICYILKFSEYTEIIYLTI